jgi:phosphonate transport system substrate-binding protein
MLRFTYQDTNDYNAMVPKFDPLFSKIFDETGFVVKYVGAENSLAAIESGNARFAGISTGKVPTAIDCANFQPLAVMADLNGVLRGYRSYIFTRKDSGITDLAHLQGETVAFTEDDSASGYKLPVKELSTSQNLTVGEDFTASFQIFHPAVMTAVKRGTVNVGAIASNVVPQIINGFYAAYGHTLTQTEWDNDFTILWQSDIFPQTAFGVTSDLDEAGKLHLQTALTSFVFNQTAMGEAYGHNTKFSTANAGTWSIVRDLDTFFNSFSNDCPSALA